MYSSRPSTFCTPDCIAHCSSEGMFRGANSAVAMADNFVVGIVAYLVLEKQEFGAKASTDLRRMIDAAVALMVDEQLRKVSLRLDYYCNV